MSNKQNFWAGLEGSIRSRLVILAVILVLNIVILGYYLVADMISRGFIL